MKAVGFSVVEFLLYIGIMTLIMGCTTTALMYNYIGALKAQHVLHDFCMLSTASDVFAHDVYEASDSADAWHQPDAHTLIWRCGTTDVGWTVQKTKLVRLSGTYDKNRQRWVKRTISVMATGITACTFALMPDTQNIRRIHTVCCEFTGQGKPVTRRVTVRIGRMV